MCIGKGEIGGTPFLDCTFTDDFKDIFTKKVISNIQENKTSLDDTAKISEKMAAQLLVFTKAASEYTDNFKSCTPNYEKQCLSKSTEGISRDLLAEKAKEYGFEKLAQHFSAKVSEPK